MSLQAGRVGVAHDQVDERGVINPPTIPNATKSVKGIVKVGDNINVSNGTISVPVAARNTFGLLKIGDNLSWDSDSRIYVKNADTAYKGVVQIQSNGGIGVDSDSCISVNVYRHDLTITLNSCTPSPSLGYNVSLTIGMPTYELRSNAWTTTDAWIFCGRYCNTYYPACITIVSGSTGNVIGTACGIKFSDIYGVRLSGVTLYTNSLEFKKEWSLTNNGTFNITDTVARII